MWIDLVRYSLTNLRRRQLRSWLTILGIVIGIAAIVALVSIAQGLDAQIRKELSVFGADMIQVSPGRTSSMFSARTGAITEQDAESIRKIGGVKDLGYLTGGLMIPVSYNGQNATTIVVGTTPNLFTDIYSSYKLKAGRWFRENRGDVAVIGSKIANGTFSRKVEIGKTIEINGRPFRVIGIMDEIGGLSSMSGGDSMIYIPIDNSREIIEAFRNNKNLWEIHIKVDPNANTEAVAENIELELMRRHHVSEENKDFTVITAKFIMERVAIIFGLLSLFLGGVAAIALLVGGIGVANTMFMAVLERTREIGILKAIGATRRQIMMIFLIESAIIGLVGGFLGVLLGCAISLLLSFAGVPSVVSAELIVVGIFFSIFVGALSGYFPARRAANLNPVEALRYE